VDGQQIRINTATAQEIEKLYRVGSTLAERIVSDRDSYYFSGLEDLAEVPGISAQLAHKLDSDIDWRIPEEARELQERSWFTVILMAIIALPTLYALNQILNHMADPLTRIRVGAAVSGDPVRLCIDISMAAFYSLAVLIIWSFAAESSTRDVLIAHRFRRAGFAT
jgi:competence ComEA-like helix-hairpin-helix protein